MTTKSITEMVKGGKLATFTRYRDCNLWYTTECGFEFPVPTAEAKGAEFQAQEKALLLMRYIRKHIELAERGDDDE